MQPLPGHDSLHMRPAHLTSSIYKPPLPTLPSFAAKSLRQDSIEVQLPPLIAGALVAAFASAVADGLGNALLTHYYPPDQKVPVNLDRAVDRLIAEYTRHMWDELFDFYSAMDGVDPRQVTLLFKGPVRQIVLVLNGPEVSRCILDKIGPGLSRRPLTWSTSARGISLALALQLLCGYWHRECASRSPDGNPEEIARALHGKIVNGEASRKLLSSIRRTLLSPHFVQMHVLESTIWDIVLKKPGRPPSDGFHVVQFKFDCQLFGPQVVIKDDGLVSIGSLSAVTGTAGERISTTISDYMLRRWPRTGHLVLGCIDEAARGASDARQKGEAFSGISVWDGTDGKGVFCRGLRLLHVEVEDVAIRLSVSAWVHTLIEVLQQMAWLCVALSASPFSGSLSECSVDVSDWVYLVDSVYVNCSMAHRPVAEGEGMPGVRELPGAAIARGFPIDDLILHVPS